MQALAPAGFNIGINDGAAAGQTVSQAHVHVIPRYVGDAPDPRGGVRWELGHNFVLAHGSCNLAKADHLAAVEHLARWSERNRLAGAFLVERFAQAMIVHDEESSRRITRWAYQKAAAMRAMTWIKGDRLEPLLDNWMCLVGLNQIRIDLENGSSSASAV